MGRKVSTVILAAMLVAVGGCGTISQAAVHSGEDYRVLAQRPVRTDQGQEPLCLAAKRMRAQAKTTVEVGMVRGVTAEFLANPVLTADTNFDHAVRTGDGPWPQLLSIELGAPTPIPYVNPSARGQNGELKKDWGALADQVLVQC